MLINESKATALHYGFNRRNELDETHSRYVIFVDIGHSKSTVTFAGLKKNSASIYISRSDRNLGGRDLDYAIMKKLGQEF